MNATTVMGFAQVFKAMGPEDRLALAQLKAEEIKRVGKELSTRDIIEAVTPGLPTPAYLLG